MGSPGPAKIPRGAVGLAKFNQTKFQNVLIFYFRILLTISRHSHTFSLSIFQIGQFENFFHAILIELPVILKSKFYIHSKSPELGCNSVNDFQEPFFLYFMYWSSVLSVLEIQFYF